MTWAANWPTGPPTAVSVYDTVGEISPMPGIRLGLSATISDMADEIMKLFLGIALWLATWMAVIEAILPGVPGQF